MDGRRKHVRVRVRRNVEIRSGDEVFVMRVADGSLGGLYVEGRPGRFPNLRLRTPVSVEILPDAPRRHGASLRLEAKVARVQAGNDGRPRGFGLEITRCDALEQLRSLLTEFP